MRRSLLPPPPHCAFVVWCLGTLSNSPLPCNKLLIMSDQRGFASRVFGVLYSFSPLSVWNEHIMGILHASPHVSFHWLLNVIGGLHHKFVSEFSFGSFRSTVTLTLQEDKVVLNQLSEIWLIARKKVCPKIYDYGLYLTKQWTESGNLYLFAVDKF